MGALWAETLPLTRALAERAPLGPRIWTGRLRGQELAVLTGGVGPVRAGRRTAEALRRWDADRVLSFGTCGALREDLPDGTVVSGASVGLESGSSGVVSRALAPLVGLPAVSIATVSRVVVEPNRRAALASRGFSVCEMEAHAVLEAAGGRVAHALKVVSDQAGADASPVFYGPLPSPLRIARFQARAFGLVQRRLLPALCALLERPDSAA